MSHLLKMEFDHQFDNEQYETGKLTHAEYSFTAWFLKLLDCGHHTLQLLTQLCQASSNCLCWWIILGLQLTNKYQREKTIINHYASDPEAYYCQKKPQVQP